MDAEVVAQQAVAGPLAKLEDGVKWQVVEQGLCEPEHDEEVERLRKRVRGSGGSFYSTQASRVGKRFASALVVSTLEGRSLYRDAFGLLGLSKVEVETFNRLAQHLGVV